MLENLKIHFGHLAKRKSATSKLLYNYILETVTCDSSKKFTELQDVIFQQNEQLDSANIAYLRKLFQIKQKWALAHMPNVFTGGLD
jgi:hypothetical protein